MRRARKLILICLTVSLMIAAFCVPASAATRTLKLVSKIKYGNTTYFSEDHKLKSSTNGKTKTLLSNYFPNKFYTDGTVLFYTKDQTRTLYEMSLKTGKSNALCSLAKYKEVGGETFILRAVGNAFIIRDGQKTYLVNIATKKVTLVHQNVALPGFAIYKGYVYMIVGLNKGGSFAMMQPDYEKLIRYRLRDGARTIAPGRYSDVRVRDGKLFVTKHDIKANKYRVYQSDVAMKNQKAVTGRLSTVPAMYESIHYFIA